MVGWIASFIMIKIYVNCDLLKHIYPGAENFLMQDSDAKMLIRIFVFLRRFLKLDLFFIYDSEF